MKKFVAEQLFGKAAQQMKRSADAFTQADE
jgi:hypothetical protein